MPYEKGFNFLYFLQTTVGGRDKFVPFFKFFIQVRCAANNYVCACIHRLFGIDAALMYLHTWLFSSVATYLALKRRSPVDLQKHAYKTVNSEIFKEDFLEFYKGTEGLDAIDWDVSSSTSSCKNLYFLQPDVGLECAAFRTNLEPK